VVTTVVLTVGTMSPGRAADGSAVDVPTLPDLVTAIAPSVVSLNVSRPDGTSQGTGFVVAPNGVVATNFHVVEGATAIEATLKDGVSLFCTGALTVDRAHDLALLKFGAKGLPVLPLADDGPPQAGERIAVIGSPHGLEQTVTDGIVSAVRRDDGWEKVQISAPISHGSSGSPVVNLQGKVIGVATFSVGGQALNFASSVVHLVPLVAALEHLEESPLALVLGPGPGGRQDMAPPPTPVPDGTTPDTQMGKALGMFWESYLASLPDNTPGAWASHFSDAVDYQYKTGGSASRRELEQESRELRERYPLRSFRLRDRPEIIPLQGDGSRLGFDFAFEYRYGGAGRTANGVSSVELALQWTGTRWEIDKFRERVDRE